MGEWVVGCVGRWLGGFVVGRVGGFQLCVWTGSYAGPAGEGFVAPHLARHATTGIALVRMHSQCAA